MAVTVDDVKQQVAEIQKLSAGAAGLEPWWDGVCTAALASALADVQGALIGRGFTVAQLDLWDSYDAVVLDQAVFWAGNRAGGMEAFDDKFIKQFDRREWLKTVVVLDGDGALVGSGTVGHGKPKWDEDVDVFVDSEGKFKPW